jgi:hypothetical protein
VGFLYLDQRHQCSSSSRQEEIDMSDSKDSVNNVNNNDDAHQKAIEQLWGDSLRKLTPKQRQLVIETLKNMKKEYQVAC